MGLFPGVRPGRKASTIAVSRLATASCLAIAILAQSSAVLAQQLEETVIHNGLIINEDGRMLADIRIQGEKIVEIGPKLVAAPGAREIDAAGMLLMPGAIDTHTHLLLEPAIPPKPGTNSDNLTSGSSAALAGGVTTVSNFIPFKSDEDPNAYTDRIIGSINRHAIADVFIHASINPVSMPAGSPPDPLTEQKTFDALAARGIVSTGENFLAREAFDKNSLAWMRTFRASGKAGVVSMLHAEDYSILAEAQSRLVTENGGTGNSLHNFAHSAPIAAEVLAVQRGVAIAEVTGSPIFILHVSSGRALNEIEEAQRRGLPVYAETRPMYLHVTAQKYQQPDVGLWIGGPPLRDKWDLDTIWEGIRKGVVNTIGSDHTGYTKEDKLDPTQTISKKRMGINNVQDYPAMMFSEGVGKGRITLEQFVGVTSTNAAKIFGMYPRKGVIQVGSDADVVIWDPTMKKILKDSDQFSNAKFSSYAGMKLTGFPKTTIRRGEVVYDKGKILGKPGSGRFIPGDKFQRPALRPLSD